MIRDNNKKSRLVAVLVTFVVTLVATLAMVNFTGGEKRIEEQVERAYALQDDQFQRALGVLLGPPITAGNRFEALYNGDEIFPSMLAAIRGARRSITFETYIYWSGDIGRAFADALAERALVLRIVQCVLALDLLFELFLAAGEVQHQQRGGQRQDEGPDDCLERPSVAHVRTRSAWVYGPPVSRSAAS